MSSPIEAFQQIIGTKTSQHSPSPYGAWLDGLLLEVKENGFIKMQFEVRKDMTNPLGIIHGGVVAGILDDIMGMAVFTLGRNEPYVSTHLKVDFLSSAKMGETIVATCEALRAGKTLINMTAKLENEQGKLIAIASSSLLRLS